MRGSKYKIPYFLKKKEKIRHSLLLSLKKKKKLPIIDFLIKEIIEAFYNQGNFLRKCNEIYKLASKSKVFAQYRWF